MSADEKVPPVPGAVAVVVEIPKALSAGIVGELFAMMNRLHGQGVPLQTSLACVGYGYGSALRQLGFLVNPDAAVKDALPGLLQGYAAAELEISRQGGARPS